MHGTRCSAAGRSCGRRRLSAATGKSRPTRSTAAPGALSGDMKTATASCSPQERITSTHRHPYDHDAESQILRNITLRGTPGDVLICAEEASA